MFNEVTEGKDFSPMRLFQEAEKLVKKDLKPGEELDWNTLQALGILDILFIGNSKLNPDILLLRPQDYQSIGNLNIPGKSCMLDPFSVRAKEMKINKDIREVVVQRSFGKSADRRDNVYIGEYARIYHAGYRVMYAPVNTNGLHTRLVWVGHMGYGYPVMDALPDIPQENREALLQCLEKTSIPWF